MRVVALECFGLIKMNHTQHTWIDVKRNLRFTKRKSMLSQTIVADFRDMPFDDETFNLVVFDPPHLLWAGQKSFMRAQYGQLDLLTWRLDLQQGFEECFRVLKTGGTLIFKVV